MNAVYCVIDKPDATKKLATGFSADSKHVFALYCSTTCVVSNRMVYASRKGILAETS